MLPHRSYAVSFLHIACHGINCPEISKAGSLCGISPGATGYQSQIIRYQLPVTTYHVASARRRSQIHIGVYAPGIITIPCTRWSYTDANESLVTTAFLIVAFPPCDSHIVCKPGVITHQLFITIIPAACYSDISFLPSKWRMPLYTRISKRKDVLSEW